MKIRKLRQNDNVPMDLLLLADPSEEMVRGYLNKGDSHVAEVEGQVIAVYVLLPTKSQTVEIINLAVNENHQRQGIGNRMVLHAIQIARSLGCKTIEIGTGNSSIGQLALYQKCGFRITGIEKDFFVKNYPEEIYENGIQCRDMIRLVQDL